MDAQETEDADDPWAKQCNAAGADAGVNGRGNLQNWVLQQRPSIGYRFDRMPASSGVS
jgi:hypothetical protein